MVVGVQAEHCASGYDGQTPTTPKSPLFAKEGTWEWSPLRERRYGQRDPSPALLRRVPSPLGERAVECGRVGHLLLPGRRQTRRRAGKRDGLWNDSQI